MASINRSVEDVESLLEYAKLSGTSLMSTAQTLEFPDDYNPHDFVLIQLPPALLDGLKKGDQLTFRGDPEDFAVICTDNKTYEVKEAETSNSLLVVPNLKLADQLKDQTENRTISNKLVNGIHYKYLELKECLPRVHKLRKLLSECPYAGPLEEENSSGRCYTFAELLDSVQCSDEQMRETLDGLPAVHIDGHWRVLEFDYKFKVVSDILTLLEEEGWPLDAVPCDEVLQRLSGVEPRPVLQMCLNYFFNEKANAEGNILCLSDDKVARLFAEVLLKPAGKFNLNEFLSIWEQSIPPALGVVTNLSQLDGLAMVDRSTSPAVISHCPVENMPEDPIQRFQHLFEIKDKWTLSEITPYIQDLSSPKCSVSSLLAKNTRASSQNGIKYYGAKHAR